MTDPPDYDRLYTAAAKIAKSRSSADLVTMVGAGLAVRERRLFDFGQPAVDAMTDELVGRHARGELDSSVV